jgi:hypothetical protein
MNGKLNLGRIKMSNHCVIDSCKNNAPLKAGVYNICITHYDEWCEKVCNVKGCGRPISTDDFGRWTLCYSHKKWCETSEGYRKLNEIGYVNES